MSDSSEPTSVNPQITDAVTSTNVNVLEQAPAMAMGSLYQTMSHSIGMAAANAVHAQQQSNISYQAATVSGVALLLGTHPSAALGRALPDAPTTEQLEAHVQDLQNQLSTATAALEASRKEPSS